VDRIGRPQAISATEEPDIPPIQRAADATFRIGTLVSAEPGVDLVHVQPCVTLNRAVACMMAHDISHLPVMPNEYRLDGVITWKTIGQHISVGQGSLADTVETVMQAPQVVNSSEPFFRVLPQIIERNYVLVRDGKNRIVGIVTKADVSRKFQELTEPFLLLAEIEHYVRRIVERGAFSRDELVEFCSGQAPRDIESLHELTLGEYVRILQHPTNWDRLNLPAAIDREEFSTQLDAVRRVRNDVMHFDPDSPTEQDLKTLRRFAKLLQTLRDRDVF
jgi:predicted transcriptional regulator